MNGECRDKRFSEMIHAYELGRLTDEERQEFELHLMECEYCFKRVQAFRETTNLLLHDRDVQSEIKEQAAPHKPAEPESKPHWLRWTIAAAAVLVLLILKPWQISVTPDDTLTAAENRLAVVRFDNIADPSDSTRLGETIVNLLIADLSESRYIDVVSSQWLFEIKHQLGYNLSKQPDSMAAIEIARRARARYLLTGRILQVKPNLVLVSELVDLGTGVNLSTQRVDGIIGEDIFNAVDSLSAKIKADLPLPQGALIETDRPVADVTTHSSRAYRYYLDGLDLHRQYIDDEAADRFLQAVRFDTSFAMAYFWLARTYSAVYLDTALKYLDKASNHDQLVIRHWVDRRSGDDSAAVAVLRQLTGLYPQDKEAWATLGTFQMVRRQFAEALQSFDHVLAIDPYYTEALNSEAYLHQYLGHEEEALAMLDRYLTIAPDEPNPYDSRGDILRMQKKPDSAIASYETALEKYPEFHAARYKLAPLYLFKGEYDKAEDCYRTAATARNAYHRSVGKLYLALAPLYQGQFAKAQAVLDDGLAADRLERTSGWNRLLKHLEKGMIYLEKNRNDSAAMQFDSCFTVQDRRPTQGTDPYRALYIIGLARAGEIARAQDSLESFRIRLTETEQSPEPYYLARGGLMLIRGDSAGAVDDLSASLESTTLNDAYYPRYLLAMALYGSGQYDRAIEELSLGHESLEAWRALFCIPDVKAYLYLGLAFEQIGKDEQAIASFEEFVRLWDQADPGTAELDQAREHLKRLTGRI
ncbi:MAG TPA: tetratricopeptide repeat protein [candidate division Zixibacteria bacterium]|nr:tetratricopeptide repeat protein [candidate division Zixibacteria bacterium]